MAELKIYENEGEKSSGMVLGEAELYLQRHLLQTTAIYKQSKTAKQGGQEAIAHSFEIDEDTGFANNELASAMAKNIVIKTPDNTWEGRITGNTLSAGKTTLKVEDIDFIANAFADKDLADGKAYSIRILSPSSVSNLGTHMGHTVELQTETPVEYSQFKRNNATIRTDFKSRDISFTFKVGNVSNEFYLGLFFGADEKKLNNNNAKSVVGISSSPSKALTARAYKMVIAQENTEGKWVVHTSPNVQIKGESYGETIEDYRAISYKCDVLKDAMYPREWDMGYIASGVEA